MNRFVVALVPLALLTAVGWADTAERERERILLMQRNRQLIEALVDRGVSLAGEEDPVKRAGHLGGLAETVAAEIRTAARASEGGRIEELGKHLKALLQEGVVGSLEDLREKATPGSSLEQKLKEVQKHTDVVVKQLEEELERASDSTTRARLREALRAARDGHRDVVDRAGKATATQR